MRELWEIPTSEPRDIGLALSLEINRCYRLIREANKDTWTGGYRSPLMCALQQSVIENELRTAAIALIHNDDAEMKKALAVLKEVK